MTRLLSIEYFKLRHSKYFWVLMVLFLIFLLAVPFGSKVFIDYLGSMGESIAGGINIGTLPIFDFVDIWQNLVYIYRLFSIFLGFIVVISISNEFSYGTIKQNVIDGLSRREFWLTKITFIVANAAIVSLCALLVGLIMGFVWSPVTDFEFIIKNIEFIAAYFLHLIGFQLFCLTIALLIKRSGITIALMIFYIYVIEPILTAILEYEYKLTTLANLFPVRAIGNIIPNPFPKYILRETQTFIGTTDTLILCGYIVVFLFLSYRMLTKRDLR